jgi:hypothetical protein
MTWNYQYDLTAGSFLEGWQNEIARVREKMPGPDYGCSDCDKRMLCSFCPAFFRLDSGAEDVRSEYLCAVGHLRYDIITGNHPLGGSDEATSQQQEEAVVQEA